MSLHVYSANALIVVPLFTGPLPLSQTPKGSTKKAGASEQSSSFPHVASGILGSSIFGIL